MGRRLGWTMGLVVVLVGVLGWGGGASAQSPEVVEGTLQVLHIDSDQGSRFAFAVETPDGVVELQLQGWTTLDRPWVRWPTGTPVRAHGLRQGDVLILRDLADLERLSGAHGLQAAPEMAAALPGTKGAQHTLFIGVTFTDAPMPPYSMETLVGTLWPALDGFVRENSFGQTWVTGTATGWHPINVNTGVCNTTLIAQGAEAAARAAGYNPAAYQRLVYGLPHHPNCAWGGVGTVGGNPSRAWINGNREAGTFIHEFGHNLGLWHSHELFCDGEVLGDHCLSVEYGDHFDVMGFSFNFVTGEQYKGHFNAPQKERLGWLGEGGSPPLTEVTRSGVYRLEPYAAPGAGPKALKFRHAGVGEEVGYYYLEARKTIGFDAYLDPAYPDITRGVLVHYTEERDEGDGIYLLDMHPETFSRGADLRNAALATGESYHDDQALVTIQVLSVDATGASVQVIVAGATCGGAVPCQCGDTVVQDYTFTAHLGPCAAQGTDAGLVIASGVTVHGNGYRLSGTRGGTGLLFDSVAGSQVIGVHVLEFANGVKMRGGASGNVYRDAWVWSHTQHGVWLDQASANWVWGVNSVLNGASGIMLSDASSNTMGQSQVWGNPVSLHMTRADRNIIYVNGLFGDAGHAAILDDSHGNSFYWNTLICRNGHAIILSNSDDNSAIGNVIDCPVRRDEAMAHR